MIPTIAQVPLVAGSYVPVIAPIDCDFFFIIGNGDANNSAMMRSSDGTDATSYTIPPGGWYSLTTPARQYPRFPKGTTVTFLKALSGSGPAIVEFGS